MKSDKKVIVFPKSTSQPQAEEREFLPAALEIVETPASPAGRAVVYIILASFCLVLLWASLARVDIVASSSGKVFLLDGTKVIQPLETGIVRTIHVHEGQKVAAGQVLIELDPGINEADRAHSAADLMAARLEIARLKAALTPDGDPLLAFEPPMGAVPVEVEMQRRYLIQQVVEFKAKIEMLDRQREQKEAERNTIQASIEKLSKIVPIVQQRADIRKVSSDREYTSKFQYLETYQALVEGQQELLVQQSRKHEAEASIAALVVARDQAVAEYQRTLFGQLT
jgi:hemolysin D